MRAPLLKTKLYIPPRQPLAVSRPRLLERLLAAQQPRSPARLILVSAPAGFGKTTLLSEWVAASPYPTAWVSLDRGDNDPARFWAYVIGALQGVPALAQAGIGASALARLQSPAMAQEGTAAVEEMLVALINEIADSADPFALVLDDLHTIVEPAVHDMLAFLLDNLPAPMRMVAASRADPPWPLARMRVRGALVEVRSQDLRFTHQETNTFLNQAMRLDLSADDIAALETRTEGWIAGLQMAALSVQGHRSQDRHGVSRFIHSFTGSNRFILDYLVEEVLNQQPPDIQAFLLQSSLFDRLSAPLCDAALDRLDSREVLNRLEQANLFLVPLDDERRWYRYHHLFADLLRARVQQAWPERLSDLHRKASAWYEGQGLIVDAVSHALAADDVERVARLVAGKALAIMGTGQLTSLASWLGTLRPDLVRAQPWLCVAHAWVLAYVGQLAPAEARLSDVEGTLPAPGKHILGHVAAIRAYLAGLRGEMQRAIELCREALQGLPDEDLMARGFVTALLGSTLRWSGDLEAAGRVSAAAVRISQSAGDNRVTGDAFCDLAALQIAQGQLRLAAATCEDALRLADERARMGGRRLPVSGFAHARMSAVLREWNDLDAALAHATEGVELCEQWGWADGLVFSYEYLAGALQASGDLAGALDAIQESKLVAGKVSPWLESYVTTQQVGLWLALSAHDPAYREAAIGWARESGLGIDDALSYRDLAWHVVLARVLAAQERLDDALRLLERLLGVAEAAGAMGNVIEIQVLQALALHRQGETPRALEKLAGALALAEPEGYVRTFAGEGAAMAALLAEAAARGIAPRYAATLLAALGQAPEPQAEIATPGTAPAGGEGLASLEEPLTVRELEVLRFLNTHMSSAEIADTLYISTHTVRSHIKSIYGKLDAHSRTEAVDRAQALGIR